MDNIILKTETNHNVDLHLTQALDCINHSIKKSQIWAGRYNAISSILHSYFAIESAVNFLTEKIIFSKNSPTYLKDIENSIPLKRFYNSWYKIVECTDKIKFLLYESQRLTLNANLENRIRELNALRNFIVHGNCFRTTYLMEDHFDDSYSIHDQEDDIDWKKNFLIQNSKDLTR